mgnify:CR=1 FL=1
MSSIENKNFSFNEMIVHVPLCTHKEPENVLVIGNCDEELKNEIAKHKVNVEYGDISLLNSKNEKNIDVIILTDIQIDEIVLANIQKILKNDGLISYKTEGFSKNKDRLKNDLTITGANFWICMPYNFGHTTCVLASKKYHPTADIVLQRSDLLTDLNYYSTEIQHASFVFPTHIQKELTGIAKR